MSTSTSTSHLHPTPSQRRRATSPAPSRSSGTSTALTLFPSKASHTSTSTLAAISTAHDAHASEKPCPPTPPTPTTPKPGPKSHSLPSHLFRRLTKTHTLSLPPSVRRLTSKITFAKPLPSHPLLSPLPNSKTRALLTLPLSLLPIAIPFRFTRTAFTLGPAPALRDVAGFTGLHLTDLTLTASLPFGRTSTFVVACQLGALQLHGTVSVAGFEATGTCPPGWGLQEVAQLHAGATGKKLSLPSGVEVGGLSVRVSNAGVEFRGAVTVHGRTSVSGVLALQRDGIVLSGALLNVHLGAGITVVDASIVGFVGRKVPGTTGRETGVNIAGRLSWREHTLDVTVDAVVGGGWTVSGALEMQGATLGRLIPAAKEGWLDLELRRVVLVASSCDTVVAGYPVTAGVQFCASLVRPIDQIGHVTGARVDALQVRCAWESASSAVRVQVLLPTPVGMRLAGGVTSGPVSVGLLMGAEPAVEFRAAMSVHPRAQEAPLVFEVMLSAGLIKASGSGEMRGWWERPLGFERVRIGPRVALQLDVVYATVAMAGPAVAFDSGMAIGGTEASVAMAVSSNPKDEMVAAKLNQLSAADLVQFAGTLCGMEIPAPREDLLSCKDVSIYLSGGRSIGSVYYPAGASMTGELTMFGQQASLSATIGAVTTLAAKLPELQLGPLVLGATDANIELGVTTQHVSFASSVTLLSCTASVDASLTLLPAPALSLGISLTLGPALHLSLDARIIGPVSLTSLAGCDFTIHAVVEQHIISYLLHHLRTIFRAARRLLYAGVDAAHELLHAAASTLHHAHEALHAARESWDAHEAALQQSLHNLSDEFEQRLHSMHTALFAAETTAQQARAAAAAADLLAQEKKAQLTAEAATKVNEIRELRERANRKFGAGAPARAAAARAELEAAEAALEAVPNSCCGLRTRRRRRRAARAVEEARARAVQAEQIVQSNDYAAARGGKEELKQSIISAREAAQKEAPAPVDVALPELVVSQMKRGIEEFKAVQSPILLHYKQRVDTLQDSEERARVRQAEKTVQEAAATAIDIDAAKQALAMVTPDIRLPAEGEEEDGMWFDIERIELEGKLSGLVAGGEGLKMAMTVVVSGERREVQVNWGGGATGLVGAVWGGVWGLISGDDE